MKTCDIEGCEKPARRVQSKWCAMHYHRWYRHGDVNATGARTEVTASHGRRYQNVYRPNHPVAHASGRAWLHRVVLYDAIGQGAHSCHWCGRDVQWYLNRHPGDKRHPDELQPDHVNGIGDDNRPENLVPACRRCNTARGSQRRHDALVAAGWWSNHDTIEKLGTRTPRIEALVGQQPAPEHLVTEPSKG